MWRFTIRKHSKNIEFKASSLKMDQWLLEACKFLALWGGIKIWACHLRCQILYKAPTQSQTGARLTRLYISPPAPHTTLKHVLKSVLFVQTHLNPSQVPCFASVWQVLGFLACTWRFLPLPHPEVQKSKKRRKHAPAISPPAVLFSGMCQIYGHWSLIKYMYCLYVRIISSMLVWGFNVETMLLIQLDDL